MTIRNRKRGACQWNGPFKWLITWTATKNQYILIHTQVTLTMTSQVFASRLPEILPSTCTCSNINLFIMSQKTPASWFIMLISNKLNVTYVSAQTFIWQLWPCAILSQTSWFKGKAKQLMRLSHGSKTVVRKAQLQGVFVFFFVCALTSKKTLKANQKNTQPWAQTGQQYDAFCILILMDNEGCDSKVVFLTSVLA